MIDGESGQSAESPARAILLQSPGRKPWVNRRNTFIEPCKGGTTPRQMLAPKVPLLRSSIHSCLCLPRVSFRALPSLHPGLCRSVVPKGTHISTNHKRKSLGRKSLGFERKYRPTLKGFLVCIIVSVLDHIKVFTFVPLFHLHFNV